jgi:hypothetical protein
MPRATFNSSDLPAEFFEFDHDTQCQIIRIGIDAFNSVQAGVRELVVAEISEDDAAKAAAIRAEGIKSALESVQDRLASADVLEMELNKARATIDQMRAASDTIAAKRAEELVLQARRDFEIEKLQAVSSLKEQLAAAAAQTETLALLRTTNESLAAKVAALEATTAEMLVQKTKSSSAIGKAGEATVLEMLTTLIVPVFPFATVKDMTTVSHAADFHLWVMRETGKKVKILIDSKKYKRKIGISEIEKLYSDVDGDDDAHGGMLLSLDSHICSMSQFQIARTPKQKPVMFISFFEIPDEFRGGMLTWAVRALVEVCGAYDSAGRDRMFEEIEEFLTEIDGSAKELDIVIRSMTKSLEGLKDARDRILRKLMAFRTGKDTGGGAAAGMDDSMITMMDTCGHILRSGHRCGRPLNPGWSMCKMHSKKMASAVSETAAEAAAGVSLST